MQEVNFKSFINKKILLLDTGIKIEKFSNNRFINRGLLSIATYLKKQHFNFDDYSLNQLYMKNFTDFDSIWQILKKKIIKNEYKIIAVSSILIPETITSIRILEIVKKEFPNIITVMGGYYFSFFDDELFKYKFIDFVVRGEGEWTLSELLNYLLKDESKIRLRKINGVSFILDNKLVRNPRREFGNINDLPVLDYSLIDKEYLLEEPYPNINLEFNRGCSYRCTFCSVWKFWEADIVRQHDTNKIVKELYQLKELGYSGKISIEDSTLDFKSARLKKFLRNAIKIRNKNYLFDYITTRYDAIDRESLTLIKKTGFSDIILGLETASPKLLTAIRKKIDLKQFVKMLHLIRKIGLNTDLFIIVGLPEETEETFSITYDFVKDLALRKLISNVFVSHFQPYPGIDSLKDIRMNNGEIINKKDNFLNWVYRGTPLVEYTHLKKERLQEMFDKIHELNKINGSDFIDRF